MAAEIRATDAGRGVAELPTSVAPRVAAFPRLRYMGSKHRLAEHLAGVFAEVGGRTALDAFSGSGVVGYTLKSLGYAVTTNDFLHFPKVIAEATIVNHGETLSGDDVERICGRPADDRDFVRRTFAGLYFDEDDRRFLDSAWSHIDRMTGGRRALAISSLVLAAARKQPRGVFSVTSPRYDDGRRDLRIPLREHFRERAAQYNRVVFDSGRACRALCRDTLDLDSDGFDLVYLDPPYAPPRDDNCYIKRYHFLEGLSVYWEGLRVMENTKTKKLPRRATPFSSKRTIADALRRTFAKFHRSTIVLSYSSNAVPDVGSITAALREVKDHVEVRAVAHRYSFGTHGNAARRTAEEYIFVGA